MKHARPKRNRDVHNEHSNEALLHFSAEMRPSNLSRFEKFVIFLRHIYKNTTQKIAIYGPQNRK